uniref:Putative ovule protein n=1 Tax=Solanum chacoense TaxID=4108 RepID=A0A0V0GU50_SOLCH
MLSSSFREFASTAGLNSICVGSRNDSSPKLHFVVVVVVEFVLVQMMNNCYQFGSFLLVHFYLEREHLMGIELELPSLNELTKGKRYDIPLNFVILS